MITANNEDDGYTPKPPAVGVAAVATGSPLRALRESLDRDPPTVGEAKLLLKALQCDVDMVIMNHNGERVWLGPCLGAEGKRIGITDCCLEIAPCEHHRKIANATAQPRPTGGVK